MNDDRFEGSFNQFLDSEEGLRVLDRSQADPLVALLREHNVIIDDDWDLSDFLEDKPGWYVMTAEEIALGYESTGTMWVQYKAWLKKRRDANMPKQHSLSDQMGRARW